MCAFQYNHNDDDHYEDFAFSGDHSTIHSRSTIHSSMSKSGASEGKLGIVAELWNELEEDNINPSTDAVQCGPPL